MPSDLRVDPVELAGALYRAGFPIADIPVMIAIAYAESGLDPLAHNPRGEDSWGVFQINLRAHPQWTVEQATNPETASQLAYQLYQGRIASQGFNARFNDWSVYLYGQYQNYLTQARQAVSQMIPAGIPPIDPELIKNIVSLITGLVPSLPVRPGNGGPIIVPTPGGGVQIPTPPTLPTVPDVPGISSLMDFLKYLSELQKLVTESIQKIGSFFVDATKSLADSMKFLNWLGVNVPPLIVRGVMIVVGLVLGLVGTYQLVRSL